MSEIETRDLIVRRTELLANVFLTRRLNIEVHAFGTNGENPDLICTIRPDPDEVLHGFLPFGVFIMGTDKELANEQEATRFARSHHSKIKPETFVMPVIALLFSMKKDEGYFTWVVEPVRDSIKLKYVTNPEFRNFDAKQLDKMISQIKKWYQRMQSTVHEHELAATD
jgi:hypothetical protein